MKIFSIIIAIVFLTISSISAQTVLNPNQVPYSNYVAGANFFTYSAGNDTLSGSGNFASGVDALHSIGTGNQNIAIGTNAGKFISQGSANILLGDNVGFSSSSSGLDSNSGYNIVIGSGALSGNTLGFIHSELAVAIGVGALANDSGGAAGNIAIGYSAGNQSNNHTEFGGVILLGEYAGIYAPYNLANSFIAGSQYHPMADVYFGEGYAAAGSGPPPYTIHGTGTRYADDNGGDIILAGGDSKGNNIGGSIIFKTSLAGASGSTDNPLTEIARITTKGLILTTVTVPGSAGATGTTGQIAYDGSFIYVCTATNTWKRVAIATW